MRPRVWKPWFSGLHFTLAEWDTWVLLWQPNSGVTSHKVSPGDRLHTPVPPQLCPSLLSVTFAGCICTVSGLLTQLCNRLLMSCSWMKSSSLILSTLLGHLRLRLWNPWKETLHFIHPCLFETYHSPWLLPGAQEILAQLNSHVISVCSSDDFHQICCGVIYEEVTVWLLHLHKHKWLKKGGFWTWYFSY